MLTGLIMDIDHFAVNDGPGIRTCAYVKGCPLACKWCHSPESQRFGIEVLFAQNRCEMCGACGKACPRHAITYDKHVFHREGCKACGACVNVCPSGALSFSASRMTVKKFVAELTEDKFFYDSSGGGVTLSGGEVLSQTDFILAALKDLKRRDVHVIIETSGFGRTQDLLAFAEYADMFYYDFKLYAAESFRTYIGGRADIPLRNLAALRQKTAGVTLRVPLIPGITDTKDNVAAAYRTAQKLNIQQVHLLPYNTSAAAKYAWIGEDWLLGELTPDEAHYEHLKTTAPEGLHVSVQY